jgi:hypothetical protein
MDNRFFSHPILNSPYEYPSRHWELDKDGQPTQQIIDALPKEHPFEVRYTQVETVDWESCEEVLATEEKKRILGKGWM